MGEEIQWRKRHHGTHQKITEIRKGNRRKDRIRKHFSFSTVADAVKLTVAINFFFQIKSEAAKKFKGLQSLRSIYQRKKTEIRQQQEQQRRQQYQQQQRQPQPKQRQPQQQQRQPQKQQQQANYQKDAKFVSSGRNE